jgi:hypothetical protein
MATSSEENAVLAVLYEETRRAVDLQLHKVESLNARAQQLLGFSAVIVSIVAAINVDDDTSGWVKALSLAVLGLFGLCGAVSFFAWRISTYRDDPEPVSLYGSYRGATETEIRDQVIGNRFETLRINNGVIGRKERLVRDSMSVMIVGGVVLVALVVVRLFGQDPRSP